MGENNTNTVSFQNNMTMPQNQGQKRSLFANIDIFKTLWTWLNYWYIILICLVVGACGGWAYHHFMVSKVYQADATVIMADTSTSITIADFSLGTNMAQDYKTILFSRDTLKAIIEDLGLNMSYRSLKSMVAITLGEDSSHTITITVTSSDANLSKSIANSMVNVGRQRIYEVLPGSEISVIELATDESITETTPSVRKYLLFGALLGLLVPCGILFLIVALDNTFNDEEEVTNLLNLPVIAHIPFYGDKNIMTEKLSFFEREAFNTLCGNIELSGFGMRSIAITSTIPNEGKSSVSYKIAEVLTEFGKKVAYVDTDMRNSNFYKMFNIDRRKVIGLSEYLTRNLLLQDVLSRTKNDRLDLITAGKYPPNPSALLSTQRFKDLLKTLSETYDYVIIDTPPVSAVIDGVFVAKECDGCIMILEEGVTDKYRAQKTREELIAADVNIIGVVINKTNRRSRGYGYGKYGHYGAKYGRYGKKYGRYGYGRKYGYGYGYGYGKNEPEIRGYGHTPEDNIVDSADSEKAGRGQTNGKGSQSRQVQKH